MFVGAVLGASTVVAWLTTRDGARVPVRALPDEPWVSVTASEPLLRALIADAIRSSPLRSLIENVRVDARPGKLVVQGSISFLGRRLTATAVARPHLSQRRLRLGISDLRIGRLAIPLGIVAEDALALHLQPVLRQAALVITGVEVLDDGVTITARRDVDAVDETIDVHAAADSLE